MTVRILNTPKPHQSPITQNLGPIDPDPPFRGAIRTPVAGSDRAYAERAPPGAVVAPRVGVALTD
jgi:hypothetical protein